MLCNSDTASFRAPPGQAGHAARSPEHSSRSAGNFLPHARTNRGEVHAHGGSHPPGVPVDTRHVHSALEALEIEIAPDRFVEVRVWKPPREVPPVGRSFVHIEPRAVPPRDGRNGRIRRRQSWVRLKTGQDARRSLKMQGFLEAQALIFRGI